MNLLWIKIMIWIIDTKISRNYIKEHVIFKKVYSRQMNMPRLVTSILTLYQWFIMLNNVIKIKIFNCFKYPLQNCKVPIKRKPKEFHRSWIIQRGTEMLFITLSIFWLWAHYALTANGNVLVLLFTTLVTCRFDSQTTRYLLHLEIIYMYLKIYLKRLLTFISKIFRL